MLPVVGLQPVLAHGIKDVAPAPVGALPHLQRHGFELACAGGARLARRERLAESELRLCHGFRGESPRLQRIVGEADTQRRIGQFAGGHGLVAESLSTRKQARLTGLLNERDVFGLGQRQRDALLGNCRQGCEPGKKDQEQQYPPMEPRYRGERNRKSVGRAPASK